MSITRCPGHARGDPFVDRQMAAEPVVLLGHVGQRALPGQRQRRHALGLVALLVDAVVSRQVHGVGTRALASTDTAREYMVPPRATRSQRRGDPRRQHPLPRRGRRSLRLQVGDRLRRARPRPGAREGAQGARRASPATTARSLEIGSGTGYFTLNLLRAGLIEQATCSDISPGMLATPRRQRRAAGLEVARPSPPTPSSCRSRTRASTSCSATRSSTTSPTCRARSPSSSACSPPAARCCSPASPPATATAWRACPSAPPARVAPLWRRAIGARAGAAGRRTAHPTRRSRASSTSTPSPPPNSRSLATRGRLRRRARHRRGAARELVRLDQPHARGHRRARSTSPGPGASTPTAATCSCRSSTAACSSRGCRRRSSTT